MVEFVIRVSYVGYTTNDAFPGLKIPTPPHDLFLVAEGADANEASTKALNDFYATSPPVYTQDNFNGVKVVGVYQKT